VARTTLIQPAAHALAVSRPNRSLLKRMGERCDLRGAVVGNEGALQRRTLRGSGPDRSKVMGWVMVMVGSCTPAWRHNH
jgi:hypothetical protein